MWLITSLSNCPVKYSTLRFSQSCLRCCCCCCCCCSSSCFMVCQCYYLVFLILCCLFGFCRRSPVSESFLSCLFTLQICCCIFIKLGYSYRLCIILLHFWSCSLNHLDCYDQHSHIILAVLFLSFGRYTILQYLIISCNLPVYCTAVFTSFKIECC